MIRRFVSSWAARRGVLMALVLGMLTALALPPFNIVPILLLTIPGLLVLIDESTGPRRAAWLGFWFGFGLQLVGLYWITEAILVEAAEFWWLVPFAVPLTALLLAPFTAVPCAVARLAAPGPRRVLALAGAWVLSNLAQQFVLGGFPWNPLGSAWEFVGGAGDVFIQPAAWVGAAGLTLLTVLLAATPYLGRRAVAGGAVVLACWAGFGLMRLSRPLPRGAGLDVVLVQGNVAEGEKMDRDRALAIFRRYLDLTREGVARAGAMPSVVVWPETASPFLLGRDAVARRMVMQAAHPATAALVGTVRFPDPQGRPRNSLMAIEGEGRVVATYDKWHLVPFGEYQPNWAPLPVQLVPGGGFAPGPGPRTLHVPGIPPVGPLICYEAIFSGEVTQRTDRPAWMVNITNDAWFGNSSGPRQHLQAARLRAVEEGLPLMRAANTGISAGFDARGHELGRLGLGVAGVLVLPLPGALPPTPFARWGLVIPGLLGLGVLGAGLGVARRRPAQPRKPRRETKQF